MEPPTPRSRYVPQNSKKRMFPGESSSCMEADVVEIPPPPSSSTNPSSKGSLKLKEVFAPVIIDLDLDDDNKLIDKKYDTLGKGKGLMDDIPIGSVTKTVLPKSFPTGKDNIINIDDYAYESFDIINVDDFQGKFSNDEEYAMLLQAHFNSLDMPGANNAIKMNLDNSFNQTLSTKRARTKSNSNGPSIPTYSNETMQRFKLFKNFDTVQDSSDHYYAKKYSSVNQHVKSFNKKISDEWKILEKDLPESIFVRIYESRMDILRAVIIGAEGTPYHDGLYFFDVYFPSNYPNVPPEVYYHSGGLRINPNLYACGKVCLSLLNTWPGTNPNETWNPKSSTMLQVLLSIQGLILNAKPYFNEPGFASTIGSVAGEKGSLQYNETTLMLSLKTMVYNIRKPPKYFEEFVADHFCIRAHDILKACEAYIEGAQVGCLVKGGVQDVDESDKTCSQGFKNQVANFITTLVKSLKNVGAKDCDKFNSLASKANIVTKKKQGK